MRLLAPLIERFSPVGVTAVRSGGALRGSAERDGYLPTVEIRTGEDAVASAIVRGHWRLSTLAPRLAEIRAALARYGGDADLKWDLRAVEAIDSAGALILWQAWGRRFPAQLVLHPQHRPLFEKWMGSGAPKPAKERRLPSLTALLARPSAALVDHLSAALVVLGQLLVDAAYLLAHPNRLPWREISATIYQAGARALGITGLIGALIGVVLAYQSAVQLRVYGAEVFVIHMLGFSISRELGPMLATLLVAGRSGSAMTAQLGVMRLTEELDALAVLGISVTERLVFPKVVALTLTLPLLALWTDILAMLGGMVSAWLSLGIPFAQFLSVLPAALPVVNLWIGLGKAAVFGALIALTAAHFGLRIEPNTQSLSLATTNAVVVSITLVIVLDALFSILLQDVGFYR